MPLQTQISLHPTGFSCHVRVTVSRNVQKVKQRLDDAGVAVRGPVHRDGTATYVLSVQYESGVTHSRLQRLLTGVSGFAFSS